MEARACPAACLCLPFSHLNLRSGAAIMHGSAPCKHVELGRAPAEGTDLRDIHRPLRLHRLLLLPRQHHLPHIPGSRGRSSAREFTCGQSWRPARFGLGSSPLRRYAVGRRLGRRRLAYTNRLRDRGSRPCRGVSGCDGESSSSDPRLFQHQFPRLLIMSLVRCCVKRIV